MRNKNGHKLRSLHKFAIILKEIDEIRDKSYVNRQTSEIKFGTKMVATKFNWCKIKVISVKKKKTMQKLKIKAFVATTLI